MDDTTQKQTLKHDEANAGPLDGGRAVYHVVTGPELRVVWPQLQEGFEQVRSTNDEPWIPEDIYAQITAGKAWLYQILDNESREMLGFMVVEIVSFPFEYAQRLNIWVGWSRYRKNGYLGIEAAKKIARRLGLYGVVFSTPQTNSWLEGYRPLTTWYEVP